jgi:hypothetical protein
MAEWSEDHEAAIGSLNFKFDLMDGSWLNWRLGGALQWKGETAGWKGPRVVRGKPAPSML